MKDKQKYSKEELQELANGIFASEPGTTVLYADGNGTFLNEKQYAAIDDRKDLDEDDFIEIKNPKAAKKADAAEEKTVKKLQAQVESLSDELASKVKSEKKAQDDLADANDKLGKASEAIAGLNAQLEEAAEATKAANKEIESLKKALEKAKK